jgi:hypothetical protein
MEEKCTTCGHDCHCEHIWCESCEMEARDYIGHPCTCPKSTESGQSDE